MIKVVRYILIYCLVAFSSSAMAESIILRSNATIMQGQQQVYLKDVAKLKGDAIEAMGDVVVGEIKSGRDAMVISRSKILGALDGKSINWGRISIIGASEVKLKVRKLENKVDAGSDLKSKQQSSVDSARLVKKGTLREEISSFFRSRLRADESDLRITYENEHSPILALSSLTHRFEITPANERLLGVVFLNVVIYKDGKVLDKDRVRVEVSQRVDSIVAKKKLIRGMVIGANDVKIETKWVSSSSRSPLSRMSEVVGMEVVSTVTDGFPVYDSTVTKPLLVKTGELVKVNVAVGGLIIRMTAKALENGNMNQVIRVRKLRDREELLVMVTGLREATPAESVAKGGQKEVKVSQAREDK